MVAGQIDLLIMDPTTSLTQVRAGNVKAFAVGLGRLVRFLEVVYGLPWRVGPTPAGADIGNAPALGGQSGNPSSILRG
jgi:hypothetical protein